MSTSIRCCLVGLNLNSGGAERHMLQLLHHWPDRSWQFDVVLLERQGVWFDEIPQHVRFDALSQRMPAGGLRQLVWAAQLAPRLRTILCRDYDLILTFLWLPTLVVSIALRGLAPAPALVWSVQSDLDQAFRLRRSGAVRRRLVQRVAAPRVAHFIAISPGLSAAVQRTLGVGAEQVSVIPNSIDFGRINRLLSQQVPIPARRATVRLVSIGRLHPQKGLDVLLQAVADLRQHGMDVECLILGEGDLRQQLLQLAAGLDIAEVVQFVGYSANPYAWMQTADIFVLASRWEPFGIVLAEAMALGLPIVTTATDGATALITPDTDGLIVPTDDYIALSDAIRELISSPEARARLSKNAQRKVDSFDAHQIATRYEQLLRQLIAGRQLCDDQS